MDCSFEVSWNSVIDSNSNDWYEQDVFETNVLYSGDANFDHANYGQSDISNIGLLLVHIPHDI